jgi:pyruvate formate lyase activating enzyme
VGDVVSKVRPFVRYLKAARGGVTLSGGEPLIQQRFSADLFERCKALGLHTAVETSGCVGSALTGRMLDATDLFMLDIKSFDDETYARIASAPRQRMIDFARRLAESGKTVWMSIVLIPGLTDVPEHLQALASFARDLGNVKRIDVRPFHQMGREKWHNLRLNYALENTPVPTADQIESAKKLLTLT